MSFPKWLLDVPVIKLLVRHTITDAIAVSLFWCLFHYVSWLAGPGRYGALVDDVEHITLFLLVIVFALHVVYNVLKEMFKNGTGTSCVFA